MSKAREIVETLRTVLVAGDVTNANFTGADLEISKGGTGASSTGAARTALGLVVGTDVLAPDGDGSALTGVDSLPSQTSQSGKFLTTNGSSASWGTVGGSQWEYISTTTATAASTVDFETFSSSYVRFMITFTLQASEDTGLNGRIKTNGVYSPTEAQHDFAYIKWPSGVPSWTSSINQNKFSMAGGGWYDGSKDLTGSLFLEHPNSTAIYPAVEWEINYPVGIASYNVKGLGVWSDGHTGLQGFRFFGDGGTITGSFNLYGFKTSQEITMTRYHATSNGNIPFTAAEETARDAEEAAYLAGADDRLAAEARYKRNNLLAATDWTANSDVTMTTEMTAYRQALRDVPTQAGWPTNISWPTAPQMWSSPVELYPVHITPLPPAGMAYVVEPQVARNKEYMIVQPISKPYAMTAYSTLHWIA